MKISCRPVRNDWLKAIYKAGLVEASDKTRLYCDKLYLYRDLQSMIGPRLLAFHPRTMGLRELLLQEGLDPRNLHRQTLEAAIRRHFPCGAVLKPACVINTSGKDGVYRFTTSAVVDTLLTPPQELRSALEREVPYWSPLIKVVASGEEFIFQENVAGLAGEVPSEQSMQYEEVRVHTYGSEVLREGMFHRWADNPVKSEKHFDHAEHLVADFLRALPAEATHHQAWGIDVLVMPGGVARIIDINTNRGEPQQWSGFLSRPTIIGAYTRAFEREVRFTGWSGVLLRNNWGNVTKNLKKRYLEGIR